PRGEDRDRAAVGVVGGVCDELIVERPGEALGDRPGVIALEDRFVAIVQPAVADQQTKATGGEEIAMAVGQAVDGGADADRVVVAAPEAALDRYAAGDAVIDIGKRYALKAPIVPACARKDADILRHLL